MEKGKYGIRLSFYAVVAFLLVILGGGILSLMLLAGVVIFVEKSEWASRQVIEAICLNVASGLVFAVLNLFDFFYRIPFIGTAWGIFMSAIIGIVDVAFFVFAIIALVRVAKGKEANIPLASKFANWAYGKIAAKPQPVYTQQPMQQAPVQQPMQAAAPVAPMQAAPVQEAPVSPAADASACSNCGAPLSGGAFCTKCGTPVAK